MASFQKKMIGKLGSRKVKFGDVVRQVKDKVDPETSGLDRYIAGEHMDTDDLRIRRWGEINDDYLGPAFHMRFKPGQVLYGSRRTYLRKVAVPDFEGICANTTYVLEPKDPTVLLPELLPFIMQTEAFHEHSIKQSKGSVNPYINFSDITWYEFALPPLEEQHRIASTLKAINDVVNANYDAKTKCQALLQSFKKQYFIEQPEGKRVRIDEIAEVKNGTTPSRKRPDYWEGTIAWLPTGKVNERFIDAADEFITTKALEECSLSIIPSNSLLIAMIGQGLTRGKVARLEIDACINQNFGAVIPTPTVDSWFLFYQLDIFYDHLRAFSHGTNQHALNCSLIREFPIWLPSITRQNEIAEHLRTLDLSIQSFDRRIKQGEVMLANLRENSLG